MELFCNSGVLVFGVSFVEGLLVALKKGVHCGVVH
jgi:hypothetical protein